MNHLLANLVQKSRLQGGSWECWCLNILMCNIDKGQINQHIYIVMLENCMILSTDTLTDQNEWQSQQNMPEGIHYKNKENQSGLMSIT